MENITIFRQIMMKEVITENSKKKKIEQAKREINQVMEELKKFDEKKTRALTEAALQGAGQPQLDRFRQQFEAEATRYHMQRDELIMKMDEINQLVTGEEITIGSVEGPYTLQIGETLLAATNAEIVIKDGIIIEIRNQ